MLTRKYAWHIELLTLAVLSVIDVLIKPVHAQLYSTRECALLARLALYSKMALSSPIWRHACCPLDMSSLQAYTALRGL